MPFVPPAFCSQCPTVFPSGFAFANPHRVTMINCSAGPCPNCGGMGIIPDIVNGVMTRVIPILTSPARTKAELEALLSILVEAQRKDLDRKQVEEKIEKEAPNLKLLSKILPKTRNELYQFGIMVSGLISAILVAAGLYMNKGDGLSKREIEKLIQDSVEQTYKAQPAPSSPRDPPATTPRTKPKVGRNDPCPCGSGIKYKKCCRLTEV